MSNLPRQKVTQAEREENDFQWVKDSANYYIDAAIFSNTGDKDEVLMLQKAAKGVIDEKAYSYILNPFNARANDKIRKYPARMRNYDILTPLVDMWMGEKAEEPDTRHIFAKNADVSITLEDEFSSQMEKQLEKDFINNLNKQGIETGIDSVELQDYKKQEELFFASAKDKRAIMGQEAIDFMSDDLDMKDISQEGFWDWMVCDRTFTYKEVHNNDVHYERIDPLEIYPFMSSNSKYIEDGSACVRKLRWSDSDIIDRFHKELMLLKTDDFDPIKHIEDLSRNSFKSEHSLYMSPTDLSMNDTHNPSWMHSDNYIDVYHVVWKTYRKVGILKYLDILGNEVEKEVDDSYKLDKENGDISIEWEWINQVYETWRVDKDMYLTLRPTLVQRNDLNNNSKCKLPYNGIIEYNPSGLIYSQVARGLPFQILNNILHYNLEKMINKNKDKVTFIPMGVIPDEPGWDENLMMYFADATGFTFYDETKPNALAAMQGMKVMDMSLNNYIKSMYDITKEIKQEMWELLGANRQRLGDIKASDGKGNTDQAIVRSAVITREKFRKFHRFQNKEDEGLLDNSKIAWRDGKKAAFNNSDGMTVFLNIDASNYGDYLGTEMGVFSKDTAEELRRLNELKALVHSFAQNGSKPGEVAEILDSNNFHYLKTKLKKIDEANAELEKATADAANQAIIDAADKELQKGQEANAVKVDVANINADASIEVALIQADVAGAQIASTEGKVEVDNSFEDRSIKRTEESNKHNRELKKQSDDTRLKEKELKIKEKDIDNKLKVAKENKNRHDTPK